MPGQRPRLAWPALLVAALVALATIAPVAGGQTRPAPDPVHGVDVADMDLRADPRHDFYRFANGGWLDRTTIPADAGQYGVHNEIDGRTTRQLLDLMARLTAEGNLQVGTDEWKAVQLYRQGIDVATRNRQGIDPIRPTVAEIDAIRDLPGLHRFLEESGFRGVPGLLPIFVFPDLANSDVYAAYLGGPFLGLPNRDYYLEEAPGNAEVRAAYVATSAQLLGFLGYDDARAQRAAQAVYDLERALAEPTLTREEQQDFSLYYNPTPPADLAARYPLMDWPAYLDALGLDGNNPLIVVETRYLAALPGIVAATPLDALKDHLKLQLLWTTGGFLSEAGEAAAFAFRGTVLEGVEAPRPVESRSLAVVNLLAGDAVGKLYVAAYFPPEAKAEIEALSGEIVRAFRLRLEANPWMTPETKAKAIEKLAALKVKVGYPDRFRSYEALAVADSYAGTALNAAAAEALRSLRRAGQAVDRSEWAVPPQTVDAFYDPLANAMTFPAGILQPPFFDHRADPASNFGGIGIVIGHEITHGFDLQGSQFDARGNLASWWTPADYERFQALNARAVAQFSAIEVLPGHFVDGQITVTENVADLGGVQVAYDALEHHLATRGLLPPPPPALDAETAAGRAPHFSPRQRFFIAAATIWREQARDESLRTQLQVDNHAPASVRATQPPRNMDAFFAAFGIEPGDPMYLPPAERVVVW